MTELQLLLVEDDTSMVDQYQDVLEDYVKQHNVKIKMKDCKNLEKAKKKLNTSFDAVIVDLNLGGDTRDGGEVIEFLKKHFRVPVVIFTGTPADADTQPPVIDVFTKGEDGFCDVLNRLWQTHCIGLMRIMGGRGLLEEKLNTIFLENLLPTLDAWIGYGEEDKDKGTEYMEKALLRYALSHLVAELDGDETPCYPEEFYLAPPLDKEPTTGSLVKRKKDKICYVVMTPACDLVLRNGKPKVDSILLAEIVPEDQLFEVLGTNEGRKKKLRSNNDKNCYHWLPKSKLVEGGFLDFCQLQTVSRDEFDCEFECLKARIASGFIKDVVSRFSTYYARQGQPTIKSL